MDRTRVSTLVCSLSRSYGSRWLQRCHIISSSQARSRHLWHTRTLPKAARVVSCQAMAAYNSYTGVSPEVQKTLEVQNSVLRVNSSYQRSLKNTGICYTIMIACMRSLKANDKGEQAPKFENWCCSTSRGPAKFGADFASMF